MFSPRKATASAGFSFFENFFIGIWLKIENCELEIFIVKEVR